MFLYGSHIRLSVFSAESPTDGQPPLRFLTQRHNKTIMKLFRFSPASAGVAVVTAAALTFTAQIGVPFEASAQTDPTFRMVLQPGSDESSVIVSWRTKGPADKEVLEITGPEGTQTFDAQEKDAGAVAYVSNNATATGLKENTEYTYRVGSDEGGWSAEETFNTGSFGDDWRFITVADAQIGVDTDIKGQTDQWNTTIKNATADYPDANMIWSLGDQVEGWGSTVAQYDGFFSAPAIRNYPTNAIPGNHETYPSDLAMKHYDEHFINPNQDSDLRNFYFERNNVLFIGLDTNAHSEADIDRHAEFLRKTIENRGAFNDWVIIGMHHSFFSQGTHYTDTDVTALREKLAPVMSDLDVDVVLSGHDHIYTRTHLMDGLTPVETPGKRGDVLDPNDGEVLYITTSSAGGGKFYDFQGEDGKKYPNARMENMDPALVHDSTAFWRQDYDEDYMVVDVTGETLTFRTYNANNPYLVDKVTINNNDRAIPEPRKEEPTTPAPATTTEVVTTVVPTTITTTETKEVPTTVTTTLPAEKTTKVITTTVPTTEVKTETKDVPTTITSTVKEPTPAEVETKVVPTTVTSTVKEPGTTKVETTVVPTTVTSTVKGDGGTKVITKEIPTTLTSTVVVPGGTRTETKVVPTTITSTVAGKPQEPSEQQPRPSEEPSKDRVSCEEISSGSSGSSAHSSESSSDEDCMSSRGGVIGFLLGAISALVVAGGAAALAPNSPLRDNIQHMLNSIFGMYIRLF